ncbi:ATP-binding cassette domain-containing protein, partial [Vibrio sp. V26_P1S5P106]|uniref:ATP-binding cassette domain-containing protein n=2 Tax=Vibrionaceae TaxID=641 RepID=UPI00137255A0
MSIKLTASQLSMRFNERGLFHISQLALGPHDAIYLKGDNGVGKTTLLKILAGLLTPTTGIVSQHQVWWRRLLRSRAHKNIVYLHQTPYLFDDTVYRNVAYGIRFSSLPAKDKRNKVITALRMVGLETLAHEHISVLSGGEKQRVAMARAW